MLGSKLWLNNGPRDSALASHDVLEDGLDSLSWKSFLEALPLKKGKGVVFLVELRLEGMLHVQTWPCELNPQVYVSCSGLNLFFLEVEMVIIQSTL